ncbi:hypothetical protein PanWU01x14_251710 [Parasponia andersonii]|uniref:Uncharacterized protein n=1 Tax=Parasponia andersonii TaxID=3476 RepID=A0A2P5BCB2_PARAD|nr:hypothetical protein PanWU01x14_251710 [Parasponia andersonii]
MIGACDDDMSTVKWYDGISQIESGIHNSELVRELEMRVSCLLRKTGRRRSHKNLRKRSHISITEEVAYILLGGGRI